MRPSVTRNRPYGAKEAEIFLNQVLPSASHVPIQIAHLAGAGGFDDPSIDKALSVFIGAIARRDKRMANVYFDICGVAGLGQWKEKSALIAQRIRQIGVKRIVWGSDGAFGGGMTPAQALRAYRELPLTEQEFQTIDTNLAPYMR
jgi:predicted TIM-barrel fold metal-dependent hydrolase